MRKHQCASNYINRGKKKLSYQEQIKRLLK